MFVPFLFLFNNFINKIPGTLDTKYILFRQEIIIKMVNRITQP
ncbi:hypothetical protein YB51_7680 [Streptococcus suis YB51]|nr:hypothetical protein YB51_7680 [Streptococcus suis YB51]